MSPSSPFTTLLLSELAAGNPVPGEGDSIVFSGLKDATKAALGRIVGDYNDCNLVQDYDNNITTVTGAAIVNILKSELNLDAAAGHADIKASLMPLIAKGFSFGVISDPESPGLLLTSNDPVLAGAMAHALKIRGIKVAGIKWGDTATTLEITSPRNEQTVIAFRAAAQEIGDTMSDYVRSKSMDRVAVR